MVYVGDYVDRGLESRAVIELLIREPLAEFHSIYLLGNHDAWLLSFLIDARIGPTWLRYGGDATLHSYGVRLRRRCVDAGTTRSCRPSCASACRARTPSSSSASS